VASALVISRSVDAAECIVPVRVFLWDESPDVIIFFVRAFNLS
jgi:hypothetical protein